jgi:hypothetical protein
MNKKFVYQVGNNKKVNVIEVCMFDHFYEYTTTFPYAFMTCSLVKQWQPYLTFTNILVISNNKNQVNKPLRLNMPEINTMYLVTNINKHRQ